MTRLLYDGVRGILFGSLTAGATTINFTAKLTYAGGIDVPTIGAGDYIPLAILDPSTGNLREVVRLTAYTAGATTGTISRASDLTTAKSHTAASLVVCAPLVGDIAGPPDAAVAFPWAANWSTHGSLNNAFVARRGNKVQVDAYGVRAASNMASGSVVGTLAAGFRPPRALPPTRMVLINSGGTFTVGYASVATNGQVSVTTSGAVVIPIGAALLLVFDFPTSY